MALTVSDPDEYPSGLKDHRISAQLVPPMREQKALSVVRYLINNPKTSVLNKFNQCHDAPNVFVTDGACMVSTACQNPSLTYMALTARACEYAVEQLKRGEIK